ncbi:MAG: DUF3611 family protein [Aphanocapsa feldmannii 277cV]|uniref:DUF3611 family protein n=2 Tax=Aphanocapsa feldmannii TaxID=192050 RepID=A0A524RR50_9CHRO|nr:MAG: DUF3611 family protein [Aphanocapsa feldmannii 288cV]TGG96796.1 MAG: DUF3611 family protein [Aphanocapsa feldmannii 277cV]TGH19941.1 MAG: DUF3611 family protein [Aphanocapsa feldmannii 277cI]
MDRLDLQRISTALRRIGWITFWAQLVLAVVVMGVLFFNAVGSRLTANPERALGLGPGLSLTTLSFFVLLFALWQDWGVVRCGRALAGEGARPSRGETSALIKRGILASLLGLVLGAIGYQALAGSLFVQASSQAPGFFAAPSGAGGLVSFPITSIEMLSVLSNTQAVMGHLIGLIASLWLLQRIHRRA